MKSVLDVSVSCFANFKAADKCKPVNLLQWLTSTKYANQVDKIRLINDKHERDAIKSTLPAITPSGLFTRRNNTAITRHSGLICLDIDSKGNERIANYLELKHEFSKIINVAYAGLSVSGTGFFLLIPIAFPEQHTAQFNALRNLFQERYEVRVDSTPDVSRLRGYSCDSDAYFNHQATPFSIITTPPPAKPITTAYSRSTINTQADLLQSLLARVSAANEGERHNVLLKESRLAGGLVAAGRIDETTIIDSIESIIGNWPNAAKSSRTIRDGIRHGKESPVFVNSSVLPIVSTIAEQIDNPGSVLRPNESRITRIPIVNCNNYPAEWDKPNSSSILPTIRQVPIQHWLSTHKVSC